ncbi:hypothetical protein CRG98_040138 [Punica granatum]|uniref:U6 snRNA phosphodiesterase 1 n=1 Tax=Punica granatum TaxID=22663 RepID=A0A2I0I663_PUNGR|nr:hypothetical protein CRG98_040138 [Punica granatum]
MTQEPQALDYLILTSPIAHPQEVDLELDRLRASYGCSSDSDTDDSPSPESPPAKEAEKVDPLPPPPLSLISPPNSLAANIIAPQRPQIALLLKRVASLVPDLFVVDADVPLGALCKDEWKLQQVALGQEFHISLGRTVPIRVHQIDSVVTMLRQKLQSHKRFWIDFSKWEVFVNDDSTRTFLSLEVTKRGLSEIMKQIKLVNEVYRLHDLPEFYKDPRPHISLVWASGDISESLKKVVVNEEINGSMSVRGLPEKCFLTSKFSGIECKIGKKSYKICKLPDK